MIALILIAVPFLFSSLATSYGPRAATACAMSVALGRLAQPAANPSPSSSPVDRALRARAYPWYDANADALRPVWPTRIGWLEWLMKRIDASFERIGRFLSRLNFGRPRGISVSGDLIGTIVLLAALALFLASVFWLWRRRQVGSAEGESARGKLGTAARLSDLPEGIGLGDGDPWAEALSRRAAGDLAGAVICLFAYQLLSLDQLGLIRLVPGRTGRQYLHVVRDQELAGSLAATLGLFEDVYYGRRRPTALAFDSVWNRALLFRERGRLLGAGASR